MTNEFIREDVKPAIISYIIRENEIIKLSLRKLNIYTYRV